MIALDTNVIVRLLTNDDEQQARVAAALVTESQIYLTKTVLLETVWVLSYAYDLDRTAILDALRRLLGLPNLVTEEATTVRQVLAWYEAGADFADALHVASAIRSSGFATFDRKLVNRLGPLVSLAFHLLQ
ncbi:MAG: type II toxin-antitoxin system VapC family toxin [Anaerolineales bacterium]|nr:type II toxin-antitoxin system VapC family toxin [Anaerolineales bacterium]